MNGSDLNTTEAVIEALGGLREVAALTGRKPNAVWNWKQFKTFPSNTYLAMTAALERAGKHAPSSLWGMVEPPDSHAGAH